MRKMSETCDDSIFADRMQSPNRMHRSSKPEATQKSVGSQSERTLQGAPYTVTRSRGAPQSHEN